jgi:hypothetical protein
LDRHAGVGAALSVMAALTAGLVEIMRSNLFACIVLSGAAVNKERE